MRGEAKVVAKVIAYSLFLPLIPFFLFLAYGGGLDDEPSHPALYVGIGLYALASLVGFAVMFPLRHDLP